jgi:hypothetical protein
MGRLHSYRRRFEPLARAVVTPVTSRLDEDPRVTIEPRAAGAAAGTRTFRLMDASVSGSLLTRLSSVPATVSPRGVVLCADACFAADDQLDRFG